MGIACNRRVLSLWLVCLLLAHLGAGPHRAESGDAVPEDGSSSPEVGDRDSTVKVDFSVARLDARGGDSGDPAAGDDLLVRFRISDSNTGFGLSELHPAAWITPRERGEGKPDQQKCEDIIRGFSQFGVSRADDDLNSYYILTLTADNRIAVINPVVNLNSSNLKSLITLEGTAGKWDFDERTAMAYVTLPDKGQVAVVDIKGGKVAAYHGVGVRPGLVSVQSDGRYVWVANDGSASVSVLDSEGASVVKTIGVGEGPIDFAFDDRGRFAFAGASGSGRLDIIDVSNLSVSRVVEVGKGDLSLAWSPLASALYVLNSSSNEVSVIYPTTGRITKTVPVAPGTTRLRASQDGDYVMALNPEQRAVAVIDTASGNIVRVIPLSETPTDVVFSSIFAYVYHAASSNVTIIQLSGIDDVETPPTIIIPMGVERPEDEFAGRGLLPMDLLPEEGGAVVANPKEKVVYFYTDGMMSPMGSFKTWTAEPLGLILYDRSLQERRTTGVYETVARLDKPGIYDVPFVLPSPKVVTCFELIVGGEGEELADPPVFQERFSQLVFEPGEEAKLRFALLDRKDGSPVVGVKDVRIVAFVLGQNWSARRYAADVGGGVYEAGFTFPKPGKYAITVEAPSVGVAFKDTRHTFAYVDAPVTGQRSTKGQRE
ncbi:MAG: YncE family protein [Candidatus Binatia bacterium]